MAEDESASERAARRQRQGVKPSGGRKEGLASLVASKYVPHVLEGLATLPMRAVGASEGMRTEGQYNPGPMMEAAGLVMGGTAFGAPKGALGAGPVYGGPMSPLLKKQGKPDDVVGPWPEPTFKPSSSKSEVDPAAEKALAAIIAALSDTKPGVSVSATSKPGVSVYSRAKAPSEPQFIPLDWKNLVTPSRSPYPDQRLVIPQHAMELGFNPEAALYKGRSSKRPNVETSLPDPLKKNYERGLFFGENPRVAAEYGPVTSYVARAENPAEIDWRSLTREGNKYYNEEYMTKAIDKAREKGIDLLRVKGIDDLGGIQNQLVVLDPSIVRLPKAAFDPLRLRENNLLAGLGGLAAGGTAGLAALPQWLPPEYRERR